MTLVYFEKLSIQQETCSISFYCDSIKSLVVVNAAAW